MSVVMAFCCFNSGYSSSVQAIVLFMVLIENPEKFFF